MNLARELCALARRYLTLCEQEFATAVAGGDYEWADVMAGEASGLAAALKRQERAERERP